MVLLFVGFAISNVRVGQAASPRPTPQKHTIPTHSLRSEMFRIYFDFLMKTKQCDDIFSWGWGAAWLPHGFTQKKRFGGIFTGVLRF